MQAGLVCLFNKVLKYIYKRFGSKWFEPIKKSSVEYMKNWNSLFFEALFENITNRPRANYYEKIMDLQLKSWNHESEFVDSVDCFGTSGILLSTTNCEAAPMYCYVG